MNRCIEIRFFVIVLSSGIAAFGQGSPPATTNTPPPAACPAPCCLAPCPAPSPSPAPSPAPTPRPAFVTPVLKTKGEVVYIFERKNIRVPNWIWWQKVSPRYIWYTPGEDGKLKPVTCRDVKAVKYQDPFDDKQTGKICNNDSSDSVTPYVPSQDNHPLKPGDGLVIAIYNKNDKGQHVFKTADIASFILTVDSKAATPLTPAPLRPTQSASVATKAARVAPVTESEELDYYFLPWLDSLTGDVALTVTLSPSKNGEKADASKATILGPVVFPQTHTVYYFNIATGVIASTLRSPLWTREESAAPVLCPAGSPQPCVPSQELYQTVQNPPGARTVDPVALFTIYAWGPFDAERKWHAKDLLPEPSFGFSLTSPSTDFFVGASSEIFRGVQVVGGRHIGKINELVPTAINDPTSSVAPLTVQRFHPGWYGGVTFNFSFITGLFTGKGY